MRRSPILTVTLIALGIFAYLGRAVGLLVSVAGAAAALYLTRKKPLGVQASAVAVGTLLTTFGSEVVHVFHHRIVQDQPDHGGFWMSALLVGLINAAVIIAVLWIEQTWRERRQPG